MTNKFKQLEVTMAQLSDKLLLSNRDILATLVSIMKDQVGTMGQLQHVILL